MHIRKFGEDVSHISSLYYGCLPLSCELLGYLGMNCENGYLSSTSSYWYSNGFSKHVTTCPVGHCIPDLNYNKGHNIVTISVRETREICHAETVAKQLTYLSNMIHTIVYTLMIA